MRSTMNTTAQNQICDRQDRITAGVDVRTMHLTHARLRLHARLASLECAAALAGGKRALKPAFPGAASETEQGSSEPRSSVVRGSYRPWRSPRAMRSPAFAAIA